VQIDFSTRINLDEHRLPGIECYTLVREVFPTFCSIRKVLLVEGGSTGARIVAALATGVHQLRPGCPRPCHPWGGMAPCRFPLIVSHLPVQDLPFATAISPEPKGDQKHGLLAGALMPLALAFVQLDGLGLALHAQPNAVELHYGRYLGDGFTACLLKEGFDLIDAFVNRT
jgi:hypothetical protein